MIISMHHHTQFLANIFFNELKIKLVVYGMAAYTYNLNTGK